MDPSIHAQILDSHGIRTFKPQDANHTMRNQIMHKFWKVMAITIKPDGPANGPERPEGRLKSVGP